MHCRWIKIPITTESNFAYADAIVCGRRTVHRCIVCKTDRQIKLCDYVNEHQKTCDRPVCAPHALHVEPDTDYCPAHAKLMQAPGYETNPFFALDEEDPRQE